MRGGVKIEREDMSAQELRRLAGGVKDGRVSRRLTSDQMAQLATWVEDGPDPKRDGVLRWRRVALGRRIEVVFGIKLHERTVGTYLARPGFRRLSVRPEHPRADPRDPRLLSERVGFDRIHVFTRQVEAAFAKHNAFNLSGEFNLTRHALKKNLAVLVAEILPDRAIRKAFGDMVPGRGKGWSTRDADPHPGKARDTPAHPSRYALQMDLYLRGGLSGTRNSRRADLAMRQYRSDGIAPRRDRQNRGHRRACPVDRGCSGMA